MTALLVAFITVGDTARRTGGYLYHREVFARLRARGVTIAELVPCGAALAEQQAAAPVFGAAFDPGDYDVVVVDALARGVVAPWLDGWRAQHPLVAMIHELPSVAGDADPALEAPLLRADRLIAVSAHGRALLVARGVDPSRIQIVSPGRDRVARVARAGLRPGGQAGQHSVLCVAQWIPRKGLLELVRAWGRRERPQAQLDLVGETSADPAYAALVHAALAQAVAPVQVHGVLDDAALAACYRRASAFVLPAHYEGYGMAVAEALTWGLPVIVADAGPVPELVGAGGVLVPPGDEAALDAALTRILADTAWRAGLARAAQARAAALPTWDDTAHGFYMVLEEAATRSSRP